MDGLKQAFNRSVISASRVLQEEASEVREERMGKRKSKDRPKEGPSRSKIPTTEHRDLSSGDQDCIAALCDLRDRRRQEDSKKKSGSGDSKLARQRDEELVAKWKNKARPDPDLPPSRPKTPSIGSDDDLGSSSKRLASAVTVPSGGQELDITDWFSETPSPRPKESRTTYEPINDGDYAPISPEYGTAEWFEDDNWTPKQEGNMRTLEKKVDEVMAKQQEILNGVNNNRKILADLVSLMQSREMERHKLLNDYQELKQELLKMKAPVSAGTRVNQSQIVRLREPIGGTPTISMESQAAGPSDLPKVTLNF
ncbi:putative P protein [Jeremy Point nyavirus]|uniref:P protein n=1 Tax=Jeremy Point nyavirus TaxID=2652327 RepID=A0AAE6NT46_9MONO|nr:putative P protein [Jeremy Point nyavirus]QFG01728.1 putative P protein [Jeremy Point nyavirus]